MNNKSHIPIVRVLLVLFVQLLFVHNNSIAQSDAKKFDRKKWKELVDDVRKRRYDPKELDNNRTSEEESYSDAFELNPENDEYNTSSDEGINDASGMSDDDFFSEENDRGNSGDPFGNYEDGEGDGEGNGYGNGNGDGFGDGNGDGTGGGEGSTYSRDDNSGGRPNFTPQRQPQSQSSSSVPSTGGGSATVILIIMGGILVALLVYMIIVSFKDKNKKVIVTETVENKLENLTITKSELELALEAALKNNNYREAVRIYFIAVIKEMKDRNWIKWEKKKTNYNYINEISGKKQQPEFITATRAFEIVWYGNRSIAKDEYHQIEPVFKNLLKSIQ
jgi:hypothetical protein